MAVSKIPNQFRLVRKSVNTGSFSIGANSGVTKSIPFTVDAGYSFFGILRVNTTSATITIGNTYVDGSNFSCTVMNIDSSAKNITVYIDYLISKG